MCIDHSHNGFLWCVHFSNRAWKKCVCLYARKKLRIDKLAKSICWLKTLNCGFQNQKNELNDILHGIGKILLLLQSERFAVLSILNDSLLQVQCKSSESKSQNIFNLIATHSHIKINKILYNYHLLWNMSRIRTKKLLEKNDGETC